MISPLDFISPLALRSNSSPIESSPLIRRLLADLSLGDSSTTPDEDEAPRAAFLLDRAVLRSATAVLSKSASVVESSLGHSLRLLDGVLDVVKQIGSREDIGRCEAWAATIIAASAVPAAARLGCRSLFRRASDARIERRPRSRRVRRCVDASA